MKRLSLALFALLLVFALAVPTALAAPAEASGATRVFVDSAGREVTVPTNITRIAPSGKMAHIVLYAIADDAFVCLSNAWTREAEAYIPASILSLPVVGQFYGDSTLNLEALAAADPDVIIDIGEAKSGIAADMDAVQAQLGIPTVFIEADMAGMGESYRMLGDLLGRPERAAALADYCDGVYQDTVSVMANIPDKARVLYALGENGLNVIAKGSYHAEVIDLLADNVALVENPSTKAFGDPIDVEQLLLWTPDVVFFAPDVNVGEALKTGFSALEAVATGHYHVVPAGPFNWMGFPPSVNRYMGMVWMSQLLYPGAFSYDLPQEVARYYDLFYHVTLTPEQIAALLEPAL